MGGLSKGIARLQKLQLRYKAGCARVWCQSKLFPPPPKGTFPPAWMAVKSAYPPVWRTDDRPHGLVAIGGVLTEESLLTAYSKGVHPFCDLRPIRWVAFNPRMVLFPEKAKLGKGIRTLIRSGRFVVTFDTAFEAVLYECSQRSWTWLVNERIDVAVSLHRRGQAHSVEVWNRDGKLVAGLFGVGMGRVFIGESAFSAESNAMKVAFAYLNCHLQHWGYALHDAQAFAEHLRLMGFEEIPRRDYVRLLRKMVGQEIKAGPWSVDQRLDVGAWNPSEPGSQLKEHPVSP